MLLVVAKVGELRHWAERLRAQALRCLELIQSDSISSEGHDRAVRQERPLIDEENHLERFRDRCAGVIFALTTIMQLVKQEFHSRWAVRDYSVAVEGEGFRLLRVQLETMQGELASMGEDLRSRAEFYASLVDEAPAENVIHTPALKM